MKDSLVIGVDFGTDSARAAIVNARTGNIEGEGRSEFARWKDKKYCIPEKGQFRQHPLDYIESLSKAVSNALANAGAGSNRYIKSICIDSTGSTPAPMDDKGHILALLPEFRDNPNAMFSLWKDHSATKEAREFNNAAIKRETDDFLKYQGYYSSEWFWAKILRAVEVDQGIRRAAYTWIEECEWLPAILCGEIDPDNLYRSACAAGHKALWHSSFGGLPSRDFLASLDPYLGIIYDHYNTIPQTPDKAIGRVCSEWAEKWDISTDVIVAGSQFDAHAGAVGAGIRPGVLVKVIGTSSVDMLVEKAENIKDMDFKEYFGQAENSILPGYVGIEAGQAAFGDIFAWYKDNILLWPSRVLGAPREAKSIAEKLLPKLEEHCLRETGKIPKLVSLDWFNGRRYPRTNDRLKSAIIGLDLSTDAVEVYRSLVVGTIFGSKRIVNTFQESGIRLESLIAVGGVAQKSPFIMQTMADVLDKTIQVSNAEKACAKGSAMYAAVAAGLFQEIGQAQEKLGYGIQKEYRPRKDMVISYGALYKDYLSLGDYVEAHTLG
jgi:L-ribulokinase